MPIFVMLKGVLLNYCKTKWNTDFRLHGKDTSAIFTSLGGSILTRHDHTNKTAFKNHIAQSAVRKAVFSRAVTLEVKPETRGVAICEK